MKFQVNRALIWTNIFIETLILQWKVSEMAPQKNVSENVTSSKLDILKPSKIISVYS